jgi:hypothetical protein
VIRRYLSTTLILLGLCALWIAWIIAGNPQVSDLSVSAAIVVGIGLVSAGFFGLVRDW